MRVDAQPSVSFVPPNTAAGIWLLMAAATDSRFSRIWLDGTPHSFRAALDTPVHRNLHEAVLPGFALRWDLADIVAAIGPKKVIWSSPVDWMGRPVALGPGYRYVAWDSSA